MEKRSLVFLEHVVQAFEKIVHFTEGVTYDQYLKDEKLQDLIIRKIEISGEAVKNISNEIRKDHPEIPWKDIAGMRDKLIHAYFKVDLRLVWNTAVVVIPSLLPKIKKIMEE